MVRLVSEDRETVPVESIEPFLGAQPEEADVVL
jgi:hypothetical protein